MRWPRLPRGRDDAMIAAGILVIPGAVYAVTSGAPVLPTLAAAVLAGGVMLMVQW